MSEPASFFLRVSIAKSQLDKFLQAAPSHPAPNQNWKDWWNSREKYGDAALADEIHAWDGDTNGAIVDGWLADPQTASFSTYDESRQVREFVIMMCSESYGEILLLLGFCQSLYPYQNTASPDDFAVIYPFFWADDNVMAYMTYEKDGFMLAPQVSSTGQIPNDRSAYAEARLQAVFGELQSDLD